MNYVIAPINLLKPNKMNKEYFTDLTPEEKATLRQSIQNNGIRDPLKVLPDYTIIAGHARMEIAKELGFTHVPVVILDKLSDEEAEYLLIADNVERRHSDDPIKRAKRDKVLANYWNIRRGGDRRSKGQNVPLKKVDEIAAIAGYSNRKELQRSIKLNDLIPELQEMVSNGKLGTTAAEQLAYIDEDVQWKLFIALSDNNIEGMSVKKATDFRRAWRLAENDKIHLQSQLIRANQALAEAESKQLNPQEMVILRAKLLQLQKENESLKSAEPVVFEKIVEKVIENPVTIKALREAEAKIKSIEQASPQIIERVPEKVEIRLRELEKERAMLLQKLQELRAREEQLNQGYEGQRRAIELNATHTINQICSFLKEMAHLKYGLSDLINADINVQRDYYNAIDSLRKWCEDVLKQVQSPSFYDNQYY